MQTVKKPVSKLRVVLTWVLFLGVTIGAILLVTWRDHESMAPSEPTTEEPAKAMAMAIIGGLFLVGGLAAYFILLATNLFTSNFQRPIWGEAKGKLYVANIVVLTGVALGIGFCFSPFTTPFLARHGVSDRFAFMLPVMAVLVLLQVVRVFVLVWAPVEKRLISKRLQACGITPAQLETALFVGISDPTVSSFKKFAQVEDDLGALWFGPDQLVYCGDKQRFSVLRQQLTQIERRADTGGTTMLGGVTHVILHVLLPDNTERQIRFHTEGHWTMGQKGRAMDDLEQKLVEWQGAGAAVSGPPS
jgi:hypothetical protein